MRRGRDEGRRQDPSAVPEMPQPEVEHDPVSRATEARGSSEAGGPVLPSAHPYTAAADLPSPGARHQLSLRYVLSQALVSSSPLPRQLRSPALPAPLALPPPGQQPPAPAHRPRLP